MASHFAKWLKWRLPEAAIGIWAVFLGMTIWAHVRVAQQPPIYDAASYYHKAYNFWQAVSARHIFNPLNLEPTVRPPGTVLMSYPFGFDPSPLGFYFRSIFFPAVLFAASAVLVCYRSSSSSIVRWRVAAIAVFFSTPPILYQFAVLPDASNASYWGLVDNFMSGVAAFAAAAAWRGATARSLGWLAVTALASSFCILIKPSGTIVAALVGMASALFCLIEYRRATARGERGVRSRLVIGVLLIAITDVLVVGAALSTKYLSAENIASGRAAVEIFRALSTFSFSGLYRLAHEGPGEAVILWMVLAMSIVAAGWYAARRQMVGQTMPGSTSPAAPATLAAAVAAAGAAIMCGLWWWLGFGGEIRYGMPFFMIAMVWAVPPLMHYWDRAPRFLAASVTVLMVAASANLALLLVQSDPPAIWQQRTGISLDPGRRLDAMAQFRQFVDAPRETAVLIYSFETNEADRILSSLTYQRSIFHPELPGIDFRRPLDWARPSTFHIDEMISSDYLMFCPITDDHIREANLAAPSIDSFQHELTIFAAWATGLTPADGVEVVLDSPEARILRVRDRQSLAESLRKMIAHHRWRSVFTESNPTI